MSDFIDKFENVLCQLKSDTETIILGDFNIFMKNNNNSLGISFTNIIQLFSFEQIIKEPTRVTGNCSWIIDFILCNKPENIVKSGSICVGLSDHNIIYCCRKIKRTTSGKHKHIKIIYLFRILLNVSFLSLTFRSSNCFSTFCSTRFRLSMLFHYIFSNLYFLL